jgi:hypothetical protein
VTTNADGSISLEHHLPRKQRWFLVFGWFAGAIMFGVCAVFLWWMLFPVQKFTQPVDGQYTILNTDETVAAGHSLNLETIGFCNDGVQIHLDRQLTNQSGYISLRPITWFAPPGPVCEGPQRLTVWIPYEVPPGKWTLVFVTTYKANPVRTVTLVKETPPFTVLPQDEKPDTGNAPLGSRNGPQDGTGPNGPD